MILIIFSPTTRHRVVLPAKSASAGRIAAFRRIFGLYSLNDPLKDVPQETVSVVTIDSLGLPRLDFLKIDVEGMEIAVLRGARDMIARFVPRCWIEYWKVGI